MFLNLRFVSHVAVVVFVLLGALLVNPGTVSANDTTVEELQALVDSLQAEVASTTDASDAGALEAMIAALLAQIAALQGNPSAVVAVTAVSDQVRPIITGTASGTQRVSVEIVGPAGYQYRSSFIPADDRGVWQYQLTERLANGSFDLVLKSGGQVVASSSFTITNSQIERGLFEVFVDEQPTWSRNLPSDVVVTQCEKIAKRRPTQETHCTWQGEEVYRFTPVSPSELATCTLSVFPAVITPGATTTITWTSSSSTVSARLNLGVGIVPLSGTLVDTPREWTRYVLTVTNAAGYESTCQMPVRVPPIPDDLKISESSDNPDSYVLEVYKDDASDYFNVLGFTLDATASGEDIELETLPVTLTLGASTSIPLADLIDDAELIVDGHVIEEYDFVGDGTELIIEFDVDGDVWIDRGETADAVLEVAFEELPPELDGITFQAKVTPENVAAIAAEGMDDLTPEQLSGSATGAVHRLYLEETLEAMAERDHEDGDFLMFGITVDDDPSDVEIGSISGVGVSLPTPPADPAIEDVVIVIDTSTGGTGTGETDDPETDDLFVFEVDFEEEEEVVILEISQ